MAFSISLSRLLFLLSLAVLFLLSSCDSTLLRDIGLENPVIHISPSPITESLCERVRVASLSRLNLRSYPSSLRITLKVSETVPERFHGKFEFCFHRNASIGLCECKQDEWQTLQKGKWDTVFSPFEVRFIDVKSKDKIYGPLTVSVDEEFQSWRLFCLGVGFLLLLLAPIVSSWVPFYYSTSMALGILLVVLLILFQGMKLLPMGRKNIFYLTIYGSVLGIGSFIVHYFSTVVNSILVNFGLSEEMHNPVSVFLLVGILLAGAALGYWIVRKFVLSEDGNVDAGIAQFVKWAMRVIAVVSILQSTLDPLLGMVSLAVCWSVCLLINPMNWRHPVATRHQGQQMGKSLWQRRAREASASYRQAQFLSRSAGRGSGKTPWRSPSSPYSISNSPFGGQVYSSPTKKTVQHQDYYSTFHKTPTRRFSKKEWEDFTRESTREALADWASSPEVTKWIADNAHRMRLDPDNSSGESIESSEGSSQETAVENGSGFGLLKWR